MRPMCLWVPQTEHSNMVVGDWGSLGINVEVWEWILPVASQQFHWALGLTDKDEQLWPLEEVYGR